ncbi:type I-E CRISPR-associated protein Cse2/CasB [Endozoicomonas sp. ISHI1]|uniref:type I-E CRISPR-associated protein Cse2/CasB n=1 Tax=Endozoicomonas sp. ISHI1 TaxID=2825882 RepID=UPI0021483093|nr:type I-E CRISPR-associated protein Cse2/CasB [Endozoicomonas sp. ISHI1]
MKDYRKLNEQDQKALLSWWESLPNNRGERAQLRRVSSSDDILLTSAFAHFLRQMPGYWGVRPGERGINLADAAMVAAVLARVKEHNENNSFATSLAMPKEKGGKAAMSELRFQQLQKSRTEQEFFTRICRVVNLLGGKVNILSLADSILHWLSEFWLAPASRPQDRLAVIWASEYYGEFKD